MNTDFTFCPGVQPGFSTGRGPGSSRSTPTFRRGRSPFPNVAAFLADWTRVSELVDEVYNRLYVATTVNTVDDKAHAALTGFSTVSTPRSSRPSRT